MIKLFNDDCLNVLRGFDGNKKPLITNNSVDCIIADLPYFGVVENSWDNQWKSFFEYQDWLTDIITGSFRCLKENSNIILFTGRSQNRMVCEILDDVGFEEKRIIIWARKRAFNNTRGKALASGYEPICYYSRGENTTFNSIKIPSNSRRKEYTEGVLKDGVTLSDVWTDIPALPHNSKEKVDHPTQKPLKLMERIVTLFTNEGDTVLDFCMGSGTTGVACKNLNRNFIGIEKELTYFDIAQNRLIL
jgi:site-specific DNA-methyltransferase (adenine-specific)